MADTVAEHVRRYNEDFDANLCVDDMDGKWLWEAVPKEHHGQLAAYLSEPDFFGGLPVMPDAQRVLERLSRDHDVYVASAAMEVPMSFAAKFRWMGEHFPFIKPSHIVFCGEKSILRTDYLIDDNPRQLRAFQGEGLLFSAPHNRYEHGWRRLADWADVERFFYR